jgi:hypothetical protein
MQDNVQVDDSTIEISQEQSQLAAEQLRRLLVLLDVMPE